MVHPRSSARAVQHDDLAPLEWLKLSDDEQQGDSPQANTVCVRERALPVTVLATDGMGVCVTRPVISVPRRVAQQALCVQGASTPRYTATSTSVLMTHRATAQQWGEH